MELVYFPTIDVQARIRQLHASDLDAVVVLGVMFLCKS